MPKPKYSDDVKKRCVQLLACFDGPSAVAKTIKEEFGVVISAQAVEAYDPNKVAGKSLSKRLKVLFEKTRTAFLEDTSGIGISHKAVRLRSLQRMSEKAESVGNMVLAANLLEQAAKEVGEAYTNKHKHELTGAAGGAIETAVSWRDLASGKR